MSNHLPPDESPNLARRIGRTLSDYVRGQVTIIAILTAIYLLGFSLIGVPAWPLIAIINGLLHAVPLIGPVIGLILPVAVLIIAGGTALQVFGVLGVYVFAQALEGFYLTPKILGSRLQMKPFVVFLAVLFGGLLFGPLGVLLAAPGLAVGMVVWRHYHREPI